MMRILSLGFLAALPSLISAGPLRARGNLYPADCVFTDYVIAPTWTGGSQDDTTNVCLAKWQEGLLVTGITTWTEKTVVQGIQVTYSDGSKSDVVGQIKGKQTQGSWDITDPVTSATVFGDGKGYRLGKMKISTKSGTQVEVGQENVRTDSGTPHDVGGGLLMGIIVATNGEEIVRGAYLFIKDQIKEVEVTDFKFDDDINQLNSQQQGLQSSTLQEGYFTNNKLEGNVTYNFINQVEKEVSRTITQTNQHTIGAGYEIGFKADILGFVGIENKISMKYDFTHIDTKTTTESEKRTLRWEASNNLVAPGKTIHCQASAQSGTFDGEYTSTIKVHLNSGMEINFAGRGELKLVGWSQSWASCNDVETPPPGANFLALPPTE